MTPAFVLCTAAALITPLVTIATQHAALVGNALSAKGPDSGYAGMARIPAQRTVEPASPNGPSVDAAIVRVPSLDGMASARMRYVIDCRRDPITFVAEHNVDQPRRPAVTGGRNNCSHERRTPNQIRVRIFLS